MRYNIWSGGSRVGGWKPETGHLSTKDCLTKFCSPQFCFPLCQLLFFQKWSALFTVRSTSLVLGDVLLVSYQKGWNIKCDPELAFYSGSPFVHPFFPSHGMKNNLAFEASLLFYIPFFYEALTYRGMEEGDAE